MESGPDYTTVRLAHANAEHLHATSTTKFIGPIPHGWYTAHKRSWLRPRTNYHRQGQTFNTEQLNTEGARDLATCPRWQAEGDVLLATTDLPAVAELRPDPVETEPASESVLSEDDTASNRPQTPDVPSNGGLEEPRTAHQGYPKAAGPIPVASPRLDLEPTMQRPAMNITSPENGISTREASTASTASFRTAPETEEEQARLFDEMDDGQSDISQGISSDDDGSDASTIRQAPRSDNVPVQQETYSTLDHQRTPNATQSTTIRNDSSQMTPSSSDANSRRSLMHTSRHQNDTNGRHSSDRPHTDDRLVHFAEYSRADEDVQRSGFSRAACPEGLELDKKTTALMHRRNNGYFNQRLLRNPFRRVKEAGELLRAERILLRVESARKSDVPSDYSDAKAHRIERRTDMHWKEFVLAARENENGLLILSFHRDRVIPVVAKNTTKIRATETLVLDPKTTKVNLYSALDKTIVIWQKAKRSRKGTMIYILRPSTTHASIQWYALIQTKLNIKPKPVAIINVPNLNMKVRIDLRSDRDDQGEQEDADSAENDDDDHDEDALSLSSISESMSSSHSTTKSLEVNEQGQIISGGVAITGEYLMSTCWKVLYKSIEWRDVLDDWKRNEKLGLCWRRYDRLEWIHGNHAKALIGQWAMQSSHELELRPKIHYATTVKLPNGSTMDEPHPIEGFLIRLTSSAGRQARFGKVFYKRLYFSSHDGLLFFSTPAKATPPPPPEFLTPGDNDIETLLKETPLIYTVEPYPMTDGRIDWLRHGVNKEVKVAHNRVAMTENARRVAQLQASDGYIDLAKVVRIRRFKTTPEDEANDINHNGHDVQFHASGDQDDAGLLPEDIGATSDIDDNRIFELVLNTGLVVRLQAFNAETRAAWMAQLGDLVKYWRWRYRADAAEFRKLRKDNMETLQIDEEIESLVGAYASKWEVSQCVSEPQIYNFCPIVSCRTIALRGLLYRKPRINATFRKHECVVSHGQLLIFNHNAFDAGGTVAHKIHQSRTEVVDLKDCYVYSGVATQNELINARDTSDRDGPGRHSLPRLYADGWTSQDEQEALSFVIWTGRRRLALSGLERGDSDVRKNSVSRLGVAGKSMIYMARSRQERDLWVQILGNEIERMTSLTRPHEE